MISAIVKKRSSVRLSNRRAIEHNLIALAIAATAGMMTIAPPALAQASIAPTGIPSATDATTQHSTCAADTQGLMCNASHESQADIIPVQAPQANPVSLLQPLSNAQMEHLADILLGLLYFVLPTGFGVGLFLHDRQQAQRSAALNAQIRLLEKLWEQSTQA